MARENPSPTETQRRARTRSMGGTSAPTRSRRAVVARRSVLAYTARRLSALAVLALAFVPAPRAAAEAAGSTDTTCVCASIPPQAFLVKQVGGERVSVTVIIESGQSPHTFEPAPALAARLSQCDVCFSIGLPFESQVLRDLRAANPGLLVLDSSEGVARRRERTGGDHGAGHAPSVEASEIDPHIWLSPGAAALIATNIRDGLVLVDPEHRNYYDANLELLASRLDSLDNEIRQMLSPFEGESFYVFHPAYGYFADEYGLRQVAIEQEGKQPGPRDLADVIREAKERGVRTIFVQPQHAAAIAEAAANEIGASVVSLDPLAGDYFSMMRTVAGRIASALSDEGESSPRGPRGNDE